MNKNEKPVYISSTQGSSSNYVDLMKKALLEGGPIVGGYMVLGDFLGLNSDGFSLGSDGDQNKVFNWDSTGKVYVPGAYNEMFPFVSINSTGGSSTIKLGKLGGEDGYTEVQDTGVKPKVAIGEIFNGFHAVVIVGWGELDEKYIKNKNVKTIKGSDGRQKLPFWICRNSWGSEWTQNYYEGGIEVLVDGKPKKLNVPGGYWLHAMYPNESMALDVPITYEGIDYGSTMVMTPEKINSPKVTIDPKNEINELDENLDECSPNNWKDSEGYNCSQYSEFGWCDEYGAEGSGWKEEWGKISDFKNDGYDASEICCECGSEGNINLSSSEEPEENDTKKKVGISLLSIIAFFAVLAALALVFLPEDYFLIK